MLPDRNLSGQIEAIQVRLDKVYNQKFYNLTSIDQYYGTQSKCCPHYVGVHEGDEVVCDEGRYCLQFCAWHLI